MRTSRRLVEIFGPVTRATGFKLFSGGVKVLCPGGDRTIPDLGVTCDLRDHAALDNPGGALIEHPWLRVEILSPSTAGDDRGEKFDAYKAIPELTHYVLVDSRRRRMMLHVRGNDGRFVIDGPLE